ncbi:MAG: hypothetical protein QM769_12085 [Pseudoxanthomonas sp.]
MAELRVPKQEAHEIAQVLANHSEAYGAGKWDEVTDDDLDAGRDQVERQLRAEWGKDYTARIALAQRVARQAAKRAPWLGDLIKGPAGNDTKLVKHFAEIGLRQARRARK